MRLAVDAVADNDRSAHVGAAVQAVGPRSLDGGNIEGLHLLAAVVPVVHIGGIELEYSLAAQVTDLEASRIVARVHDRLFGFRVKTQLVHERARRSGNRRQRKRSQGHASSRYTITDIHT